jgi:hypothetical protein
MADKAGFSLFLTIVSLGAAVVNLGKKALAITFFSAAAFCFLIFLVQLSYLRSIAMNSSSYIERTPIIRAPKARSRPSYMSNYERLLYEENPTQLFGGFFKNLK